MVLELDAKAQLDLWLLAFASTAGRCEANEILWSLLSDHALKEDYRDLSRLTSHVVNRQRALIDRLPFKDMALRQSWSWHLSVEPRNRAFHPLVAPRSPADYTLRMGEGGEPLQPPHCWQMR